jgi:hypothetical protein
MNPSHASTQEQRKLLRLPPSAFLLAAQLLLLVLFAIFDGQDTQHALISAFNVVVLVLVVWVVIHSPGLWRHPHSFFSCYLLSLK